MKTRKAKRGVQELVTESHVVYLLETKFRATLRTATQLLPLAARPRKAKRGVKEFVAESHVVHLLLHFVSHTVFLRIKDS
ncbi:hypothetical protein [Pilibacter termitis]|uniref:hypothetical protein n=1 Tax=Pilibacter termitis TaxID=263852 RepID=UPI0011869198|nr:hypothetical protein [Pilibacter termitis]